MSITLSSGLVITTIPDLSKNTEKQKQNCQEWITALRSGEYQQGRDGLRFKDNRGVMTFCCLGVACDISAKKRIGHWHDESSNNFSSFVIDDGKANFQTLPLNLVKDFGLKFPTGIDIRSNVPNREGIITLASLNDSGLSTFEDIALIMETALDGGFSA